MAGITNVYYSFLKYLKGNDRKIATLQLTGRIEDFFVKEFVYYFTRFSKGKSFALVNIGNKKQQKIDLCLIKGNSIEKAEVFGMIEAKYLRNIHRLWLDADATDEIGTVLDDLHRQLHTFEKTSHGGHNVNLFSKTRDIYGLVFASYVSKQKNDSGKKEFYSYILEKASDKFRYHDLPKPYFRPVFDDVQISVLNTTFYVTLKAGLWKRK